MDSSSFNSTPTGESLAKAFTALMVSHGEPRSMLPGDLVAARGEALEALYYVESGQLEPAGAGHETVLGSWRVRPGSCLGDVGLLQGGWVAPMDFVCTEGGVVRVFRREALVHLVSQQERDALVIYAYLAHHCAARLSSLQAEFSRMRMLLVIS